MLKPFWSICSVLLESSAKQKAASLPNEKNIENSYKDLFYSEIKTFMCIRSLKKDILEQFKILKSLFCLPPQY